jgi:hypothetical protein
MGTTLTGKRVQNTYDALLKLSDNQNLTGTAKIVGDGYGNDSPIYLSTSQIGIGITPSYQFHTSGNAKIGGNLIISGNLTVNGTLTYLNVQDLAVEDPLIKLAKDNTANTLDIGLFGKYVATGTKYKGFYNDASDDKFKLFIGTTVEPTTTVDTSASGYTVGTLIANLEGNVTGGTISGTTGSFSDDVSIAVSKKLKFGGGSHTYINEDIDDRLRFFTGGAEFMRFTEDTSNTVHLFEKTIVDNDLQVNNNISGTTATFTGLVTGIAPTSDLNFATKKYVDDQTIPTPTLSSVLSAGNSSGSNDLKIIDDQKLLLGNDGDMQIYHNQVNSVFFNDTGNMVFRNNANDKDISFQTDDGQGYTTEYLKFDGGYSLPQIRIPDNVTMNFGSDDDLKIYHDATDSYIKNDTGNFIIQNTNPDKDINFYATVSDGAGGGTEELYFQLDGSIQKNEFYKPAYFKDNIKAEFGSDSDIELFFSSADGYFRNKTGDLYIQNLADDKSIVFQSDNGIGGVTEYFKIDGNINRNVILVTTQLNDNVPMIFGAGAGRPSIKYDSTASQLFINGDTKFLSDAYIVNNLNVQKSVYQTATGGFYINKPYGGSFYTTQNVFTGAIQIALPTGGTGHDDMIKFVVDIFDYNTQECVTVFIGGYTYQNVGSGNTTWYNVSATVLGQSSAQNYTVRFGDNGTEHCVWIGDTTSTWNHLQVIVKDFFAGYTANINNYLSDWGISVVTTQTTVNNTLTNCFPMSSDTIADYLPLTGGTLTGNLNGTSAHFTGNVEVGSNANISMDSSANGQLMIDGVGYQGAIALDDQAMHIYHNSSGRSLVLGTNETARLTIGGSGNSTFTGNVTTGQSLLVNGVGNNSSLTLGANTGNWVFTNVQSSRNLEISDSDGTGVVLTIDTSGDATFVSKLSAASIGVSGSNGTDGNGISLYGGAFTGQPTYGMMFQKTSSYSTFGYVSGDWATYFTMDSGANRGWIFRNVSTSTNVASINNQGHAHFQTPSKITSNDTSLTFEDAGTNAMVIKVGAGDELYIGSNNTYQFRGTTTGQARLISNGYIHLSAGASTYTGLELHQTDGSRVGFFYGDNGQTSEPNVGILDSDGNWAVRVRRDNYTELRVNNVVKFQTTTAINYNYQPTWIEGGSANWNETTPGTTTGSLHLVPTTPDNYGSAITFGASDSSSGTNAQAGIYTRTDGSYGTKMYFATSGSYATGSSTRMMIDYNGQIGMGSIAPEGKLDVTGDIWLNSDNANAAYYLRVNRGQNQDGGILLYGNKTLDWQIVNQTSRNLNWYSYAAGASVMRLTTGGQLLVNATSSTYGAAYGYNLGVKGTTGQAYISIARSNQNLDSQGVIIGLDTNYSYFVNRDALPLEFHTNNAVRMHIHGSLNRVGIGADPVSSAGVNNFLMVKGSSHSGIVLNANSGAVQEMWNDGGTLNMWDSSQGYRMRFYTSGNAQVYNGLTADSFGVAGSNGTDGKGISLYGGSSAGEPTYGMMFMQTATFGGYGLVNGSWATYFTMNSDTSRGWIFRRAGNSNCASITAGGDLSLKGIISFTDTNQRISGLNGSYLKIQSGSASDGGINLTNTSGTNLMYLYASGSDKGMLNAGGYWTFKHSQGGNTNIYSGNQNYVWQYQGSNGYAYFPAWINLASGTGLFTNSNGGHFYGNEGSTYGAWRTSGSRNGYSGIYDNHSATNANMFDSSGNGGNYSSTAGWHFYYHKTNLCLGIGNSTTSSSYSLYVTGSIYSTQDVIAYSDKRAKENIITVDSAIEKVNKLRGVYYTPKEGKDKSRKVGVIAQEILEVLPEVVTHDKENDRYGVDYGKITGLLIEAIKDQQKQIDKLTKFVDKLNK